MEYATWAPQYARIRAQFGFPFDREEASASRLTALLRRGGARSGLAKAKERLNGRLVVVVGLAPGAGAPPLWRLTLGDVPPAVIAADGATAACLEAGIVPDLVVTDLDGPVPSEVTANARGALVVVHAHGDNRAAIERWVPEFAGEVLGSWAGPPTEDLVNVGGFTDGDRGVYLAEHLGARRILLWGFDFHSTEEADPAERARKLEKLSVARDLLAFLAARTSTPIERWERDGTRRPYPAGTGSSTQ